MFTVVPIIPAMFREAKPLAARVYAFLNAAVVLLVLLGVFTGLNWTKCLGARPSKAAGSHRKSVLARHGSFRRRPSLSGAPILVQDGREARF